MNFRLTFRLLLLLVTSVHFAEAQARAKDAPFSCEPVVPGSVAFRAFAMENYEAGKQFARFQIEETFLGNTPERTDLEIPISFDESVSRGEERIIVSRPDEDGTYWSAESFDEGRDKTYLNYLRGLRSGIAPARILGWISTPAGSPRVDAVVTAVNAQHRYESRSADGTFDIGPVVPGKYRVTAARDGYRASTDFEDVEIVPAGCAAVPFTLVFEGDVRGSVKNEQGIPQKVRVDLVRIQGDEELPYDSRKTDANGNYWFSGVDPGRYRVGINLYPMGPRQPYPRLYAPGVEDARSAFVVAISEGQSSAELDLWLAGPKLRTIEITVFWFDGSPAKGAVLSLIYGRLAEESDLLTDEHGVVKLQGYEQLSYRVYAVGKRGGSEDLMDSLPEVIPIGSERVGVRLVLSEKHVNVVLP